MIIIIIFRRSRLSEGLIRNAFERMELQLKFSTWNGLIAMAWGLTIREHCRPPIASYDAAGLRIVHLCAQSRTPLGASFADTVGVAEKSIVCIATCDAHRMTTAGELRTPLRASSSYYLIQVSFQLIIFDSV